MLAGIVADLMRQDVGQLSFTFQVSEQSQVDKYLSIRRGESIYTGRFYGIYFKLLSQFRCILQEDIHHFIEVLRNGIIVEDLSAEEQFIYIIITALVELLFGISYTGLIIRNLIELPLVFFCG